MALLPSESERVIVPNKYDNILTVTSFADELQTLIQVCTAYVRNVITIDAIYGTDHGEGSKSLSPGGYGVVIGRDGYEQKYLVDLTGKSPLEAVQTVIDVLPQALKEIARQAVEGGRENE